MRQVWRFEVPAQSSHVAVQQDYTLDTMKRLLLAAALSSVPRTPVGRDWMDWVGLGLTAGLTLVAGFTLIAIWRQAVETARAAKAAENSANAQINSERAWVIVELKPVAHKTRNGSWVLSSGGMTRLLTTEEAFRGEHLRHTLKFTNMGRTQPTSSAFKFAIRVCRRVSRTCRRNPPAIRRKSTNLTTYWLRGSP
jgi:hypothetical protein